MGGNGTLGAAAVAVDNGIVYVTNPEVGLVVLNSYHLPPEIALTGRVEDSQFHFSLRGDAGQTVRLQRSRDLAVWEDWRTVTGTGSLQSLVDETASGIPMQFYRQRPPELLSMHSEYHNVVATIQEFCAGLDRRDWVCLRSCLAGSLWTDYSSFRGTPPARITAEEFIGLRQSGSKGLVTQHHSANYLVSFNGEQAACCFEFAIRRWVEGSDARFLHTFGHYETVLERGTGENRRWVINSIIQHAIRSEGSRELHGAYRANDPNGSKSNEITGRTPP